MSTWHTAHGPAISILLHELQTTGVSEKPDVRDWIATLFLCAAPSLPAAVRSQSVGKTPALEAICLSHKLGFTTLAHILATRAAQHRYSAQFDKALQYRTREIRKTLSLMAALASSLQAEDEETSEEALLKRLKNRLTSEPMPWSHAQRTLRILRGELALDALLRDTPRTRGGGGRRSDKPLPPGPANDQDLGLDRGLIPRAFQNTTARWDRKHGPIDSASISTTIRPTDFEDARGGFTIFTAPHCRHPRDEKRQHEMRREARVVAGTVTSAQTLPNTVLHRLLDDALCRLCDTDGAIVCWLLLSDGSRERLASLTTTAPSGPDSTALYLDAKGVMHFRIIDAPGPNDRQWLALQLSAHHAKALRAAALRPHWPQTVKRAIDRFNRKSRLGLRSLQAIVWRRMCLDEPFFGHAQHQCVRGSLNTEMQIAMRYRKWPLSFVHSIWSRACFHALGDCSSITPWMPPAELSGHVQGFVGSAQVLPLQEIAGAQQWLNERSRAFLAQASSAIDCINASMDELYFDIQCLSAGRPPGQDDSSRHRLTLMLTPSIRYVFLNDKNDRGSAIAPRPVPISNENHDWLRQKCEQLNEFITALGQPSRCRLTKSARFECFEFTLGHVDGAGKRALRPFATVLARLISARLVPAAVPDNVLRHSLLSGASEHHPETHVAAIAGHRGIGVQPLDPLSNLALSNRKAMWQPVIGVWK